MIPLAFSLLILGLTPAVAGKSARQIAEEVVPPEGFVLAAEKSAHGAGIISTQLQRHWEGPEGIQMSLVFDDTNAIDSYGVAEQRRFAVEQIKQLYPEEKFEASGLFKVNGREWILIRTHGDYRMTKFRHFVLLTALQGQYITIHFVGGEDTRQAMLGYMEFVMRQISGASPGDPILPL
jgi:hypothetical protein